MMRGRLPASRAPGSSAQRLALGVMLKTKRS